MTFSGLARCSAVWVTGTVLALLLVDRVLWPAVAPSGETGLGADAVGFGDALVRGCAAVAVVGVCWLWLVATLAVLEAAGPRPVRSRMVPATVRSLVLAACGVAALSMAPAASAGPAPTSPSRPAAVEGVLDRLEGLPLPDRAVDAPPAPERGEPPSRRTVRPGDNLWRLAETDLRDRTGAWPSDAEVAVGTARLYAANRAVIGADPDLILPGQRLRLPRTR